MGIWGQNKEGGGGGGGIEEHFKKEKRKGVIFQSGVKIAHKGVIEELYEVKTPIKFTQLIKSELC